MVGWKVKKAIRAGNSSAVLVPVSWLDKEVRVELVDKSNEEILRDVVEIVGRHIDSKDVIGIYLVGSYARGDNDSGSDIDVLVISDGVDREVISEGVYEIMIVSEKLLRQKLKENLLPVGPMIVEAVSLINGSYLEKIDVVVTKKNIKWYVDTTKEKISMIERALKVGGKIDGVVAYTVVLRIRTLLMIDLLKRGKKYSKKEFFELVEKVAKGRGAYEDYLSVKGGGKGKGVDGEEVLRLLDYLKKKTVKWMAH